MTNYQGQYVFKKSDKTMLMWTEEGELSPDFTTISPPTADHEWQNNEWVLPKVVYLAQLAEAKSYLLHQLTDKADRFKAQILVGYSQAEIDSFYRQEREAREWKVNNQAKTPMLSQIVESRPEIPSLAVLVEKIIEKADTFSAVMGGIIGKKQAIETQIELAKNNEELTACEQEIEQWQLANH
ncbi:hypothetical protein HMPREF0027_2465 [Actinobacillus ureae ATCC 25976]|uniref:Uncharacterized protein n=1 Tax=Actinobacillus ureae ATCC 25976 TaxID=887324 RepID=E8KKU8_9PAST|nr:hypothetical protein [Actinobacillus ureae]EFX90480.1 hypothetical protein HMPREF0027_2465 [Actinobacillus ureae ATCC 25976]